MVTHPLWSDDYWLLLMQLYLRKPEGLKPTYSRKMVELAMELHIPPTFLHEQMFRLRHKQSPVLSLLWATYGEQPKKLAEYVRKVRQRKGFGRPQEFFEGVSVAETFEKDFEPLPSHQQLKPVSLILILDLYFRLTPSTMVKETPEVRQLAQLLKVKPELVVEVMSVFQFCDPYLNRDDLMITPLLGPCQKIWNRYGNDNLQRLSAMAAQLRDYFV